jgi:hypothetical protein
MTVTNKANVGMRGTMSAARRAGVVGRLAIRRNATPEIAIVIAFKFGDGWFARHWLAGTQIEGEPRLLQNVGVEIGQAFRAGHLETSSIGSRHNRACQDDYAQLLPNKDGRGGNVGFA